MKNQLLLDDMVFSPHRPTWQNLVFTHACLTGDCPHDDVNLCVSELKSLLENMATRLDQVKELANVEA